MSHIKLGVKDKLMDIHFLSRRALVRGLVSENSKNRDKSNLGEVKNFISHEIIIHSTGPVWEDPTYKAIRYSSGDTDYNLEDHTSTADYIDHNIFKKNVANLRDNIEWIKINSKGKDYIINLYSNSPKQYKEFIEVMDQHSSPEGLSFFPEEVILCPFNKDVLKNYRGSKMLENPLVNKVIEIISKNNLDLENKDYR